RDHWIGVCGEQFAQRAQVGMKGCGHAIAKLANALDRPRGSYFWLSHRLMYMARPLLFFLLFPIGVLLHRQGRHFAENQGQWPATVTFRGEMSGATLWIEKGSVLIDLYDAELLREAHANIHFDREEDLRHHAVRLKFLGATDEISIEGTDRTRCHHNYFLG